MPSVIPVFEEKDPRHSTCFCCGLLRIQYTTYAQILGCLELAGIIASAISAAYLWSAATATDEAAAMQPVLISGTVFASLIAVSVLLMFIGIAKTVSMLIVPYLMLQVVRMMMLLASGVFCAFVVLPNFTILADGTWKQLEASHKGIVPPHVILLSTLTVGVTLALATLGCMVWQLVICFGAYRCVRERSRALTHYNEPIATAIGNDNYLGPPPADVQPQSPEALDEKY
jgi:hypothetical protein